MQAWITAAGGLGVTPLGAFLQFYKTTAEREAAIRAALEGPAGPALRKQLGKWVVELVPVENLVPDVHSHWRPLVRDAMIFVVCRLSAARLAPKMVEQIELPLETPPETRLLHLIARVPGLQKIGQVLARNRRLHAPLRRALSKLENGISDVSIGQIEEIVREQLAAPIRTYAVKIERAIFSEASVSAVVRFTWRNPHTGRREPGVFKVLKPHIPGCYVEDMKILQHLAGYLARKHRAGRIRLAGLAETLTEIRLLLEREVDFRREQQTLLKALEPYRALRGVRVPRLIQPLSTDTITALTRENGVKVTEPYSRRGMPRARVAERLAEALIALPSLSRREVVFHADPHAGNLLYDRRKEELVILDWALTEKLTHQQRRNVLMLVLMISMRDGEGMYAAIDRLRERRSPDPAHEHMIRERIAGFLESLPLFELPGPMDAMRLLEDIGLQGIRFPASLLMFRKAAFTLEGVLEDIAGVEVRMDSVVARYALTHWFGTLGTLYSLLSVRDWLAVEWSAAGLAPRLCMEAVLRPWRALGAVLLPQRAEAA